jgi:hypothetical protein
MTRVVLNAVTPFEFLSSNRCVGYGSSDNSIPFVVRFAGFRDREYEMGSPDRADGFKRPKL